MLGIKYDQDRWVIRVSSFGKCGNFEIMSTGAVGQTRPAEMSVYQKPMWPTSWEEVMRLALCQGYNGYDYDFEFYNVDTEESIPFDLFPEIKK